MGKPPLPVLPLSFPEASPIDARDPSGASRSCSVRHTGKQKGTYQGKHGLARGRAQGPLGLSSSCPYAFPHALPVLPLSFPKASPIDARDPSGASRSCSVRHTGKQKGTYQGKHGLARGRAQGPLGVDLGRLGLPNTRSYSLSCTIPIYVGVRRRHLRHSCIEAP